MISEIQLTQEFKAQTSKAIFSIVLFVLTYLALIAFAIALTALCLYGAFLVIIFRPSFIFIIVGLGLGSLGVLVLIFLFKFIFSYHKVDRSHLMEIKRNDEPELFGMIDDIVRQVETDFPKKVYLSAEVNASVFYDSSFWSMFLPIRKNLQVGLGLVNSVSQDELKSILAHEFGHFSQRTMKVGSYVYNVNHIIFNMLNDNEGFDKLIQGWANVSGFIAIFVMLAIRIIHAIQWVLGKMYSVVNKSYLGLSREMEFHADEIAAHVAGSEPLKTSLLRMQLAIHSFESVMSFYETKISENYKSENIFKDHAFVMNHLAADQRIRIENNLPQVTVDELNKFNKSKLVIKNQWASHPSTEDRVERLDGLNLAPQGHNHSPASGIFKNIEKTQKELTRKLFSGIVYKEAPKSLSFSNFKIDYEEHFVKNTFAKIYDSYYDDRNPIPFEIEKIESGSDELKLEDLYSQKNIDLVYTAISIENDLEILKQISSRQIDIKTFDYDGKKYSRKECHSLIENLEKELDGFNRKIKQNDVNIFMFFKHLEKKSTVNSLDKKYMQLFEFENEFKSKYELYSQLSMDLQFIHYTTPYDEIVNNFVKIEPLEIKLKKEIGELLENELYQSEITEDIRNNFELYLSKNWTYASSENYIEDHLQILYNAMNNFAYVVSRGGFLLKKDLLDYQSDLYSK